MLEGAEPSALGDVLSPSDNALRAVTESRSDVVARLATGPRFDSRTRLLLEGPIVGTLLRLATPNVLGAVARGAWFGPIDWRRMRPARLQRS
jgi:hypothetical protein